MKHQCVSFMIFTLFTFNNVQVFSQIKGCNASFHETSGERTLSTTGNADMDNAIRREVGILRNSFDINCAVWLFDDEDSPNADASNRITDYMKPDGTIRLGYNMMQKQLGYSNWGGTIPFILAHEFGHVKAFKNNWNFRGDDYTVKKDELFADFCAGLYMWDRQFFLTTDIQSTIRAFIDLGDTEFTNRNHHGTPEERMKALIAGYHYLRIFRQQNPGKRFTDEDLYDGFVHYASINID
ncbi:MAG: hypothetical protein LRY55_06770 [Leadbetterella sp.]|nr:hypothetical protein [Leadbetterella sp.]